MLTAMVYKRDASGNIRTWQGEARDGKWRSHAGLMGGGQVTSEWADAPARSQPDSERQAIFEVNAHLAKLLGKDYRVSIALVDVPRGSFIKPMLAHEYKSFQGPCYIQPKLDGMRCLANVDGLWSRGAKQIFAAPHIIEWLKTFFEENAGVVLDGELYNHEYHDDFNKLLSVARKLNPSVSELNESSEILQYHIYDCYNIENNLCLFSERSEFLQEMFFDVDNYPIKLVETMSCEDEIDVKNYHMAMIQKGYEGSIIRLDKPYEQKRSKNLLKKKDFITEEFELLGIEEGKGNWSGYAKRALCKTAEGVEFGAGIKGDQSYCRELLHKSSTSFESVTIRHFGKTPDGSIRFPIAIAFNEKGGLEERRAGTRKTIDADDTTEEF